MASEQPAPSHIASEHPAGSGSAPEQPSGTAPVGSVVSGFRPEDITSYGLPVSFRGYDRERVERLLARVAEAYSLTFQQRQQLRDRLRTTKAELEAAQGDAAASARSVADLMQRCASAEGQLAQTRDARDELEGLLEQSESEREQALAKLLEESDRTAELGRRLQMFNDQHGPVGQADVEIAQPSVAGGEATLLLVAAARAAEDLRVASRARALRTLTKARERSALVHADTQRERVALAAIQERRDLVEQEADAILTRVHTEAARLKAAGDDERHRVRGLLTGAIALLDADPDSPPDDLMVDLASRLGGVAKGPIT